MSKKLTALRREIEVTFPFVAMPPSKNLISPSAAQRVEGDDMLRDIEECRGKPVSVELIRSLHQELHDLSAEAWSWILPHYLRFCMSEAGLDSRMELEHLIYKLDPTPKFTDETTEHLALFTRRQINCLRDVLRWCKNDEYWSEYFSDDLHGALLFLKELLRSRGAGS